MPKVNSAAPPACRYSRDWPLEVDLRGLGQFFVGRLCARSRSLRPADSRAPGRAEIVIERRRLKRLRLPGSAISVTRDHARQRHQVRRRARARRDCRRSAMLERSWRSACTITSYSLPSSTKVVTRREPSMVCSVLPMSLTAHAQVRGAVAVDHHAQLRPGFLVVGVHAGQARIRLPCAPAGDRAIPPAARNRARRAPPAAAGRRRAPGPGAPCGSARTPGIFASSPLTCSTTSSVRFARARPRA